MWNPHAIKPFGLTQVYTPCNDTPTVDIVFVHGLNGHPRDSWTAQSGCFWPEALLPEALSSVRPRILTYGYNANVTAFTDAASRDSLNTHAEMLASSLAAKRNLQRCSDRPLIFVCHSLGGILVKRALIVSRNPMDERKEHLRSVYVSTSGILFLGTPHIGGSDAEKWNFMLGNICSAVLPKKFMERSQHLIKALRTNNETLQIINSIFEDITPRFHVCFFYESLPMEVNGARRIIVDKASAVQDSPGAERICIEADHNNICKFYDNEDRNLPLVVEVLNRYSRLAPNMIASRWDEERKIGAVTKQHKAREISAPMTGSSVAISQTLGRQSPDSSSESLILRLSTSAPLNQLFVTPPGFHPNATFFGMQKVLGQLHDRLFKAKARAGRPVAVTISGLPGSGKTHLARQYVFTQHDCYKGGIFWVEAHTRKSIYRGFWDIALAARLVDHQQDEKIGQPKNYIPLVRNWLLTQHDWLLVFDGVTFNRNYDINMFKLLVPRQERSSILYTSVDPTLRKRDELFEPYQLSIPQLGVEDACNILFKDLGIRRPTKQQASRATDIVMHYECLPLAVHAISRRLLATSKPLEKFHAKVVDQKLAEPFVAIINEMSRLQRHQALNLLKLLSFLDGESIPVALLRFGQDAMSAENADIATASQNGEESDLDFTLEVLLRYSLAVRCYGHSSPVREYEDRHARRTLSPGDSQGSRRQRSSRDQDYTSEDSTYDDHAHHRRHPAEGPLVLAATAELWHNYRNRDDGGVIHDMIHAAKVADGSVGNALSVDTSRNDRGYYRSTSRSRSPSHSFHLSQSHKRGHRSRSELDDEEIVNEPSYGGILANASIPRTASTINPDTGIFEAAAPASSFEDGDDFSAILHQRPAIESIKVPKVVQSVCRDELFFEEIQLKEGPQGHAAWLVLTVHFLCASYETAQRNMVDFWDCRLVSDYHEYEKHASRLAKLLPRRKASHQLALREARDKLDQLRERISIEIEYLSSDPSWEPSRDRKSVFALESTSSSSSSEVNEEITPHSFGLSPKAATRADELSYETDEDFGVSQSLESVRQSSRRETSWEMQDQAAPFPRVIQMTGRFGSATLAFIDELVHELLISTLPFRTDSESRWRIVDALPECLEAFSMRLAICTSFPRNIMRLIMKERNAIVYGFMDKSGGDPPSPRLDEPASPEPRPNLQYEAKKKHGKSVEESGRFSDREGISFLGPSNLRDPHRQIETDSANIREITECIIKNPAYAWFIDDLRTSCLVDPSGPDVKTEIGKEIKSCLKSLLPPGKQVLTYSCQMKYTVDWDPLSFLEDQGYSKENSKALPLVMTITGSQKAAQALTCSQYLNQTWPSSGRETLKLFQSLLESDGKEKVTGDLSDGTRLVAWFPSSDQSKKCNPVVEVIGSITSIAEIGEQVSWLGSALRSSPYPDQVAYCRPDFNDFRVIKSHHPRWKERTFTSTSGVISFSITKKAFPSNKNGECWHNLFRNCIVVDGYPIARRPEIGRPRGLEISLPMMARLSRTGCVNTFLGSPIIKGFSSMLVPTENHGEVVVWHLLHNPNGDRISYLDSTVAPVTNLTAGQLSQMRHILGWCSEARYLAGTRAATYEVSGSRLPRPRNNGILSQAFISSGRMITGGEPFLIGYKDTPFHVSRAGYIRKLKWIIQKSAVLWDEEAKRGWLLNGASALLHLVRASIVHDSTGPIRSECVFRWEKLEESADSTPGSAIGVLLNRTNRALTIYEGNNDLVTFEDRVEHFLNMMELMFDYQVHAVGPNASGYSSKSIPRAHFEGWDFHDLATESDPLHPREAKIAPKGKTWIDFTRSIHAINFLGRGFGEILEPLSVHCPHWSSLPKHQYYLAAGIADLEMVLEHTGDLTANPIRLSENLVWHKPESVFESCGCADATDDHADIAQVILPATLSDIPEQNSGTINLAPNGAVAFGYNRNFQWQWGDAGDPERDDFKSTDEDYLSPANDISDAASNPLSFSSETNLTQISSTDTPSMEDSLESSPEGHGSARPRPVRSYTRWNLESLKAEDYAVGIVCALPLELLAVRALFDQTHPEIPLPVGDSNHYALGSIERHRVVASCLPDGEYGTNSAADVASNLRRSFPAVKFCLMVGIGGGVPSDRNDIRLGDVVVSKPIGTSPGVIQYDMGKSLENGVFEQSGFLQAPPRLVMTALSNLKSDPYLPQAPLQHYLEEIATCRKEYRHPGPEKDRLFSGLYAHNPTHDTCDSCSMAHVTTRPRRPDHHPRIHYGLIASGNRVMKNAKLRDKWSTEKNVLCFEMEAAGIMNTLPCLVIRGICDYSDSHKDKRFQNYAAATAASYAKLLLSYMKDSNIDGMALRSTNEDQSLLGALRRALYFLP